MSFPFTLTATLQALFLPIVTCAKFGSPIAHIIYMYIVHFTMYNEA